MALDRKQFEWQLTRARSQDTWTKAAGLAEIDSHDIAQRQRIETLETALGKIEFLLNDEPCWLTLTASDDPRSQAAGSAFRMAVRKAIQEAGR